MVEILDNSIVNYLIHSTRATIVYCVRRHGKISRVTDVILEQNKTGKVISYM